MSKLTASKIGSIRSELNLVHLALNSVDDYLYEGAGVEALKRALDQVSSAERCAVVLRAKLENEINESKLLRGKVRLCKWKIDTDGCPVYYAEGDEGGFEYVRAADRDAAKAILLECGHITEETRFYR